MVLCEQLAATGGMRRDLLCQSRSPNFFDSTDSTFLKNKRAVRIAAVAAPSTSSPNA